jgi:hypothetical protein
MADYRFERECRTPYSEGYSILDGDDTVGRIDLHFTTASVYGALSVTEDIAEDDIQELIATIDEELVMSADPYRTNFVVHVMQGREIGVFSDVDSDDDDDEEEEEEDSSWDTRR